jgi:hypothetical protein
MAISNTMIEKLGKKKQTSSWSLSTKNRRKYLILNSLLKAVPMNEQCQRISPVFAVANDLVGLSAEIV